MKKRYLFLLILLFSIVFPSSSQAFWIWTPETNQWTNPKYSVKETPDEQIKYAVSFYDAKKYKEAIGEFKKLIKHYPRAREAAEAQFYIGICFEEQGDIFRAFKEYQTVIDKYPFSDLSAEIVQRQYDIGAELLNGTYSQSRILSSFKGTNYNVVEVFRTVIKNAPYGELAPIAQYKIGLYLMEEKLFDEARDEFEKVINDYPESRWVKAAQYQIAVTDSRRSSKAGYDQRVTKAATQEFNDFLKVNPDAELSEQAKGQVFELRDKEAQNNFDIARFYEKQKNYASARIYYQSVADEFSGTMWARKALERIQMLTGKK